MSWFDAALDRVGRAADDAFDWAEAAFDRTIRLGVTGLSGAGKTVFITSLVENLLAGERLALFGPAREGRLAVSVLRPQPDADAPRFEIEAHRAALNGDPPQWPRSTRNVGQLRVSLRYRPTGFLRRQFGEAATLNLDIVDYPGEWLLDLPLMELGYGDWSRGALALAERPARAALAKDWRSHLATLSPEAPAEEADAIRAAELYRDYLRAVRGAGGALSQAAPGRFLVPGELAGAPALTFTPLPAPAGGRGPRGSLWALCEARYEAYKSAVVKPFFRDHFARLDRQIVLVDVLTPLSAGAGAVADLREALEGVLASFRPGRTSWLARALGARRIERVLFAATKADHIHSSGHERLAEGLGALLDSAGRAAAFAGAEVEAMALASVRATVDAEIARDGRTLPCVEGRLEAGGAPKIVYPGEPPARFDMAPKAGFRIHAFAPPNFDESARRGPPHIRLDKALDWLIADDMA